MSWLTKISLRNRSIVGLCVVAAVAIGAYAITSLKEELIPSLKFPYLTVFTLDPGASPTDVERSITTPLEQALKTTSGIKEYDSFSNDGMSVIMAQYEFGTDMKAKQSEVQQAVSGVAQTLPTGAQAPSVAALNFDTLPVVQLAVVSSLPSQQLAAVLQTKVVPELQQIAGVQAVTLSGIEQLQLQIKLDPKKTLALGVQPTQIMSTIQQANLVQAGGSVTAGSIVYPITVATAAQTIKALQDLVILPATSATSSATGATAATTASATTTSASATSATTTSASTAAAPVTLGDIAAVKIAPAAPLAVTRTNSQPTVGIAVSKSQTGNTVTIADGVQAAIPQIKAALGPQSKVIVVLDQSTFIKQSITSLWHEGLIGAIFAVLVIFAFLLSWRSTLIAGVSIPLSVIGALIILWSRGDSLNMLTLGGLTIAIGRVIDDSIVVIENGYRHLQEGDDPKTAAYTATREVSGAITASTLTTVAVFLPLGMVHGLASEFFRPFALTVTFALACSLLCALTVVPVLAASLLTKKQVGHRDPDEPTRLQRAYLPVLRLALGHKIVTLVLAAAIFLAVMLVAGPQLKTNLFDNSAQNTMSLSQQMPAGTSLDATADAATQVEDVLAHTKGVEVYQVTMGNTGSLFGAGGVNASASQATYTILTDPNMSKNAIVASVRAQVAKLSNAGQVTVSGEDASMGGSNNQIEVRVSAADPVALKQANDMVLRAVKAVDGLADVTSNLSEGRPSVSVAVDQQKAAAAGVSPATVSQYTALVLNGMPLGTVPTPNGPLTAELKVTDFTLPPIPGAAVKLLQRLPVVSSTGTVPLGSIAKVVEVMAPVQVSHVDGQRTATVTASVVNDNVGQASARVTKALDALTLPDGATWDLGGASQMVSDVQRSLGIAMLIAILVVYIIMVATFRSLLNPLILLVSIPFAAVGAVLLLLLTGTSLGMPSLIGLLMLIGIVVTNAIVLLDLVEQFRRKGADAQTAVVEGGRRRLRPILMTAIATILALTPMALGFGKGGFLSTPLAIVVIGGLFTSTILTLILVPVLYVGLADVLERVRGRRPKEAPAAVEAAPAE